MNSLKRNNNGVKNLKIPKKPILVSLGIVIGIFFIIGLGFCYSGAYSNNTQHWISGWIIIIIMMPSLGVTALLWPKNQNVRRKNPKPSKSSIIKSRKNIPKIRQKR